MKGADIMAQMNFIIDDAIKTKAESVCNGMGLTMSSAISIFLTKVANEKRIPFEVSIDPFYSEENMAELERRVSNIRSGKSTLKEHDLIEID